MAEVERNIDVVRRLEDAYARRDYSELPALIRDDLIAHTPGSDQQPQDHEGLKANNERSHESFPDRRAAIEEIFGEGDRVVARVRYTGTNRGGLPQFGIPANESPVDFGWIQISRHDPDGRIAETWAQIEIPKLMQQLGAMPAPGGM